jgi:hypothetical protein
MLEILRILDYGRDIIRYHNRDNVTGAENQQGSRN